MKKLLITIAIVLCLICIGVFVYFNFFSPESRAKSIAENYMKALITNDTQKATNLYPAKTDYDEILQRNYRVMSIAKDNATYYMLYGFSDDKKPTLIRITVDVDSIKNIETGSKLGSTPSADKPEIDDQAVNSSRCLAKSDLAYIDSTSIYARNIRGATMIFNPDTIDYINPQEGIRLLDRMANFYKKTSEKDFIFELKGYKQSEGLTEVDNERIDSLFQERAVNLQKELVSRGVSLDRILINDKYIYYIPEQSTAVDNELYVNLDIVNRCIKV